MRTALDKMPDMFSKLYNADFAMPWVAQHNYEIYPLESLHYSVASWHHSAHQTLSACSKLHCWEWISFRVFFPPFIAVNIVLLLLGGHNGLFKKALVPPLWMPQRCDGDSSWNDYTDGENQEASGGKPMTVKSHLLLICVFYWHIGETTLCANIYFQCKYSGKNEQTWQWAAAFNLSVHTHNSWINGSFKFVSILISLLFSGNGRVFFLKVYAINSGITSRSSSSTSL